MDQSSINLKSKDRSTNFSNSEVLRLQKLIEKYSHIIMCKKTDGTSVKQKENAWILIEKEFNAMGDIKRTAKQLKYKFDNMKKVAKKEASRERLELSRTGGGPPPPPPASDDPVDWLRSVMPTSIDGNESIYDDDVVYPAINSNIPASKLSDKTSVTNVDVEVIDMINNVSENSMDKDAIISCHSPLPLENVAIETVFDTSTPHSSLKRPVSSPLKRVIKRKKGCLLSKQKLHEKKVDILDQLQELELQKLRESIAQQKAEHEQRMRHNEEKHKLEMEKLNLL